jgi:UDP-N-acetylmuramoyl-tripeptide--D-alanyl-D-alanine ligase
VKAFGESGRHFVDRAAVIPALAGAFGAQDTVLVKGSRSAGMEHVLYALVPSLTAGVH